jgi:AraC family transcriptional regulator
MHRPRSSSALQNLQRPLVDGDLLVASELIARPELPPRGVTAGRGLAITFAGAFEFEVGRRATWIDPSRLLFIEAGQSYVDHHVVPGVGHSSVILRAGEGTLEELWENVGAQLAGRAGACSLRVQMLAQLLRRAGDALAGQELGIAILEESVVDRRPVSAIDQRCVRRAKALLHDCPEGRLSLSEVASELGVTPIHLTQSFKRSEGMPLYRYQTLLRLGRALDLLPDREDITDLAFELGYSSHSHFTAVFRSEIGMTPSRYRSIARCPALGRPRPPIALAS